MYLLLLFITQVYFSVIFISVSSSAVLSFYEHCKLTGYLLFKNTSTERWTLNKLKKLYFNEVKYFYFINITDIHIFLIFS